MFYQCSKLETSVIFYFSSLYFSSQTMLPVFHRFGFNYSFLCKCTPLSTHAPGMPLPPQPSKLSLFHQWTSKVVPTSLLVSSHSHHCVHPIVLLFNPHNYLSGVHYYWPHFRELHKLCNVVELESESRLS